MIRLALLLLTLATSVAAVEPDEILSDPALETRARDISTNLRCVVCQNENIDSSKAGVARDLRILVRERLVAGDSDEEIYDYMVARYGDYVLFRPPWKPSTYALWLAPYLAALIGFILVGSIFRRASKSRTRVIAPLSPQEQAELDDATLRHQARESET